MQYTVVFSDGRFMGWNGRLVSEYPDARKFSSKASAEKAARHVNLESKVEEC